MKTSVLHIFSAYLQTLTCEMLALFFLCFFWQQSTASVIHEKNKKNPYILKKILKYLWMK